MMNVFALSLVLSSLVTAGILYQDPNEDVVIVKEGHRAVTVVYEKEDGGGGDGNTKVSISPPEQTPFPRKTHESESDGDKSRYISAAKEKLSDAATTTKETAEDVKETVKEVFSQTGAAKPLRELACDAFGKCKHKFAGVTEKFTETVSEKAHGVGEQAKEVVSEAIEIAKETAEKAKTIGKEVQTKTSTVIDSAKEKTKEKAEQGKEMAEQAVGRAKTSVNRVKEGGGNMLKEILLRCRAVVATMDWVVGVVHLLVFSTAYGICLWVTFVSSYLLAGALPMHQFGMVQSKIYPVYFRVMSFSVGVALVGHLLGKREKLFTSKSEMLQGFHLLSSLLMILVNSFYLEPRATKVMFEKMKMEKEEGRGRADLISYIPVVPARGPTTTTAAAETISTPPSSVPKKPGSDKVNYRIAKLNERLKKLNAFSSILNILTLVALTWHLVYLGQRLHMSC